MKKSLFPVLLASLIGTSVAYAESVTPVSYTFDQSTSSGSWTYSDTTNPSKLTDGTVGLNGWAVNNGLEWIGWYTRSTINIDFNFGTNRVITSVSIGSTQDHLGDVVLPSFSLYTLEGGNWILQGSITNPATAANNHLSGDITPHNFYTFSDLTINSQYVRVSLSPNGPYTFVDEVKFQAVPVPEPETYAMLLAGLGLMGSIARRRKQK